MKNILWYVCIALVFNRYTYTTHDSNIQAQSKPIITNPKQSDGFGSQFQTIIAAVIYAELNNCQYVYTPFEKMEHNYTNDPDYIAKKEQLINFLDNFETIDSRTIANGEINYKAFFDTHIVQCAQSVALQKIKKNFRENKTIPSYFNNVCLHIAIHIRRPNLHDSRILGTNTPDDLFLNIIAKLRVKYADKCPLFHIYSQGLLQQFKLFEAPDVILHLNDSTEDTFLGMVFADILVIGTSSFSYTAGLLSDGIVYYTPFWHTPLPHWISVDRVLL